MFFGVPHVFLLCLLVHFIYYLCTWLHILFDTFNILLFPSEKKKNIDLIFWIRNHTYILSDKDDNLYKRKKDEKSLK